MSKIPKAKAIELLQKVLAEIPEPKKIRHGSPEFSRWELGTSSAIENIFGKDSTQFKKISEIRYILPVDIGNSDSYFQETYCDGLTRAKTVLESMIGDIETYWDDENVSPAASNSTKNKPPVSNKIFIVHGRDEAAKQAVARFIEKLSLEPIILHEKASQGRTIIEKFEEYSDVGFAIVLLTPDDIGGLNDKSDGLKLRARQNVILELGYFTAKLGRSNVCLLLKGNMENPSDFDGVLYIPLDDAGAWKMELLKELKATGYSIDANKII